MKIEILEAVLEFAAAFSCMGVLFWLKKTKMAIFERVSLSKKKEEQLSYLQPLEQAKQRKRRYWEKKVTFPLLLAGIGFLLAGTLTVKSLTEEKNTISVLTRNETGGGARSYTLYVEGEEEKETYSLKVDVKERKPSEEEAKERLYQIYERLRELIVGENRSLDEVYQSLYLPERLEDMGCTIEWMSDTWEILTTSGEVRNQDLTEPCIVYLTAKVSYGGYQEKFYFSVQIFPKRETEGTWIDEVEKHISAEEQKNLESAQVKLPKVIQEQNVNYSFSISKSGYSFGILGIVAAFCLFIGADYELPKKKKQREEELIREYSATVSKLTLLIGAGMSIRLAWERIVEDDMRQGRFNAAQQEMQVTYYELKQGETEGTAYRNFGRRIGLKPYRKLGNLLEQNLRKGNAGLTSLLGAEVTESFEIRRSRALMAGEEASSKLLIPMFLMLLMVLVICMAPALMTF